MIFFFIYILNNKIETIFLAIVVSQAFFFILWYDLMSGSMELCSTDFSEWQIYYKIVPKVRIDRTEVIR